MLLNLSNPKVLAFKQIKPFKMKVIFNLKFFKVLAELCLYMMTEIKTIEGGLKDGPHKKI